MSTGEYPNDLSYSVTRVQFQLSIIQYAHQENLIKHTLTGQYFLSDKRQSSEYASGEIDFEDQAMVKYHTKNSPLTLPL